uniref:Reverse transcriptase domain-containing protein n=1 Tax=Tanacetum cinerariifolium TaxID=118510 RepID=A0A6L2MAI9_TANCI|nr:hypothetical protein [Tanacetum cinerariifolium]
MTLFNGTCNNCIYGDGKPLTCSGCEGILRGGFCLPCDLKAENSFNCYQDAYSFNDSSNNSNYLPQPQYENYLCNLCGNNSHDGYDCQQQFLFIYEQEPSYNQNYDDNYYPHESPSFPFCDNCGGSHETFQCQPMDQNIDFSGSDQIQTPPYPDVNSPSQETSEEVSQDLMKSIETYLEKFNCIPFEEKPLILLQAWFKFFAIHYSNPKNPNELFQKLLKDLKELAKYENSQKVSEEQKQSMEDTMLELVKICEEKEFLCIHDNVDDLIESALNSKLLLINSQHLKKEQQEVKNVVEQPAKRGNLVTILSTKEPEYSSSMGYEHLSITPETESNEVIESNTKNLLPIPSECEVTLEDKRECDLPISENSPVCDNHSEIFSDSKIDDDISVYDDDFEISSTLKRRFPILRLSVERLITLVNNDIYDNSSNDPLLEEADLFLAFDSSIPPGIENFANDSEGDILFLEALLIDDSILSHESSDSNFEDNLLIPQPPPELPDAETDAGEEIPVVMNDKDKFDEDYHFFMFDKVFSFLFAESEDTIFDPGFTPSDCSFLVLDICPGFQDLHIF